jgi:hypothetical protein
MKHKIASTHDIAYLSNKAIEKDRNQALDPEFVAEGLDPSGVHICDFAMIHEHQAGQPVAPHMRTRWLLKVKDSMTPVQGLIDIDMDDYEQLKEQDEWPTTKRTRKEEQAYRRKLHPDNIMRY